MGDGLMSFLNDIDAMDADVNDGLGGVPVVYEPLAGGSFALVGMFDRSYVEQSPFESSLDNQGPSVFLAGSEVFKITDGGALDPLDDDPTVTIDGLMYRGKSTVNDGPVGRGRRLMLSKVG